MLRHSTLTSGRQSLTWSCHNHSYYLYTFRVPIPVLIVLNLGNIGKYEFFTSHGYPYIAMRLVSHKVCDSGCTVICLVIWNMKNTAFNIL
jgi:hypothetical protein